jgi:hypothetical protein
MGYGLELLLKGLSKDWDIPGPTQYKHKVGKVGQVI